MVLYSNSKWWGFIRITSITWWPCSTYEGECDENTTLNCVLGRSIQSYENLTYSFQENQCWILTNGSMANLQSKRDKPSVHSVIGVKTYFSTFVLTTISGSHIDHKVHSAWLFMMSSPFLYFQPWCCCNAHSYGLAAT